MSVVRQVLEMRGMPRSDIAEYFHCIGGKENAIGGFEGPGWAVEISGESTVRIGALEISATIVAFECEQQLMEQMLTAFRLRFLSAGG